ncbi:MAG: hypothetical protein ACLFS1_10685, partial [Opitutales bacterium]
NRHSRLILRFLLYLFTALAFSTAPVAAGEDDFTDRLAEIEALYQNGEFFAGWKSARRMRQTFRDHSESDRIADLLRSLNQARREAPEIRFAIENLDTEDPIELDIYRQQIARGGQTSEILLRQTLIQTDQPALLRETALLLERIDSPQRGPAYLKRLTKTTDSSQLALLEDHLGQAITTHPDEAFLPTLEFLEAQTSPKGAGTFPALVRVISNKKDTFGSYRPRIRKVALRYADWVQTERHQKALFAAVLHLEDDDLTRQIFEAMGSGDVSLGEKLPPGWQASQVGEVYKPGTATFRDGKFIINGAGEDIWNTSDSFYFIHKTLTGDATLTAQIHDQEPTAKYAKSGLMFRSTLDVDAAHAMSVVSPNGRRIAYQYRPEKGDSMDSDSISDYEFPIWLRLAREENQITASYSSDGETWEIINTRTLELGETIHVGLLVSSNDKNTLNETVFQLPVGDLLATD